MRGQFSPRVLLLSTLLAVLVVGLLWAFPSWRMPGPLSLAHTASEGQCALCHQPWRGLNVAGCLSCHAPIATARASGVGLHGSDQRPCNACHIEHQGREIYTAPAGPGLAMESSCIACHTSPEILEPMASAKTQVEVAACDGCGGTLPLMAIGEKLYVDAPTFTESPHGQQTCDGCHGGNPEMLAAEEAHQGLIPDPSADPARGCGAPECHQTKASTFPKTLHATVRGFTTTLRARSDEAHWPALSAAMGESCSYCHPTCGQCHVSQPEVAGGGLLAGHTFVRPPVERTCQGCHGSRVVAEYMGLALSVVEGEAEGTQPDVHLARANMTCLDCHPGEALHGDGQPRINRHDQPLTRACASCHADVIAAGSAIPEHILHSDTVSCWVCHAQPYNNCYGCHGTRTADGNLTFASQREERGFKIGRLPGEGDYVLLRHVPVARDTFAPFGTDLLPNFDAVPTWKQTRPHNIQLRPPQSANCLTCHGTAELWLQQSDLEPGDAEANETVIVEPVRLSPP